MLLHSLVLRLLKFALPWSCAGCGRALDGIEDDGFCGACWLRIPRIDGPSCESCGLPLKEGGSLCFSCRQHPSRVLIRSAVEYSGPMRRAVHRFKFYGRKSLARSFGVLMRGAWERWPELHHIQALVPVPLHRSSERLRGYNQAALLARALGVYIRKPVLDGLLIKPYRKPPQSQLGQMERWANARAAYAVCKSGEIRRLIRGKSFLLIDDVCTTRATILACARVLRAAHAAEVKALVLARDP